LTLKDANLVSNAIQKAAVKYLLPMEQKDGERSNHFLPDTARDFIQGFPDVLLLSCGFSTSASIEN